MNVCIRHVSDELSDAFLRVEPIEVIYRPTRKLSYRANLFHILDAKDAKGAEYKFNRSQYTMHFDIELHHAVFQLKKQSYRHKFDHSGLSNLRLTLGNYM